MLAIFAVYIDFTLARFASYGNGLRLFMINPMAVFGNFLCQLLKISIQINWFDRMKRDSLASLVPNNLFRSLVTTTGCVFLCWTQWCFWTFSTTSIKDLYAYKVNCAKQRNKKINKNITEFCYPYCTKAME